MSTTSGAAEPHSGARLGRILLVDDQEHNRDMLARRLERRGYEVVSKSDALTIESDVVATQADLVLLDWLMPDRSGFEALVGLRERLDAEHLPIIVLTALDDSDTVAQALEAGANDYITKPIDMRVLMARLKVQFDRCAAMHALDRIRDNLETTVQSRTRDLLDANAHLSAEIAEREAAEARAHNLARHDALTGLANRRHFLEELERRVALSDPGQDRFALLFVDLDRFKPINDVYGHLIGDQVLQCVGARLQTCLREDSFAARLGGDEFALIVEFAGEREHIAGAAGRIGQEIAAPIPVQALRLGVSASIGIAVFPDDGADAEALLQNGDAAMLRAKLERNAFRFFDAAMDQTLKSKAAIERELRLAIPDGKVVPHFQPIVNLENGQTEGFEVLARWRRDSGEMVSPTEFIAVAEEAGLIDDLFWKLLRRACESALRHPGDFTLSVNISASQVRDDWFPEKVLRTLNETGFPARRLEVEVTEGSMISDLDRAKRALLSLKNQNVSIALDDFGTGFSSLLMLRELPIDRVKIDTSFVSVMLTDGSSAAIVDTIIALGRTLGLKVTAEGVECAEVAERLLEKGCGLAQGYLFGAASETPRFVHHDLRQRA
jgi:diguanylate cyclase (GGDEF)-like protein